MKNGKTKPTKKATPAPAPKPGEMKMISLHLPGNLYEEVVKRAAQTNRSLTNFVATWLDETFHNYQIISVPREK